MEWMPIETAPKDGTAVLVTFSPEDISIHPKTRKPYVIAPGVLVAFWDAYEAPGGHGYCGGDGWTVAYASEGTHLHHGFPTHWMPLPALPKGDA